MRRPSAVAVISVAAVVFGLTACSPDTADIDPVAIPEVSQPVEPAQPSAPAAAEENPAAAVAVDEFLADVAKIVDHIKEEIGDADITQADLDRVIGEEADHLSFAEFSGTATDVVTFTASRDGITCTVSSNLTATAEVSPATCQ